MKADDSIINIIGKDLTGEITPAESQALSTWLSEEDDNKKYYDQIKVVFDRASALKNWQHFDTDKAWEKVRLKLRTRQVNLFSLEKVNTYWRVAASILILSGVGYFSYKSVYQIRDTTTAISHQNTAQNQLPDGTQVFLNKNSSIVYHYDPARKKRVTRLEGEAYFTIAEKHSQQFVVEAGDVIIEDIGTTFNVEAYAADSVIKVYVETGEVAFYTRANPGLRLTAGEVGIYDKPSGSFSKELQDANVLSYKTKVFVFVDTRMGSVIEAINDVYETKLKLENKEVENCRITVSFNDESIEMIAEILAETLKLTTLKATNEIILKGNECTKEKK